MYEDEKSENECEYCETYSGEIFAGNQLRSVFPDLTVESKDLILPNVHTTLWHTDTCKCKLHRISEGDLPADYTVYSGEVTPHYVKREDEEGYYSYKRK
jgi:thioredoxin-related protein